MSRLPSATSALADGASSGATADTASRTLAETGSGTGSNTGSGTGSDEATAEATASPGATEAPALGDLATGSATHVLAAGAAQLAVDYWTTDAPSSLGSPDGPDTTQVQLSAHLEGAGASAETRVSRFRATALDASGATAVLLDDNGSFSITAPYSCSTVVDVPTRGVGDSTTVRLQWDLLVETVPGSGVWFRQTVVDQLVIGLPAAGTTPSATSTSPSTTQQGARS